MYNSQSIIIIYLLFHIALIILIAKYKQLILFQICLGRYIPINL